MRTTLVSEQRSPFVAIRRYSMGWLPRLDSGGTSFVDVTPADARVLTMRPLETPGRYLIARPEWHAAGDSTVRIRLPHGPMTRACLATVSVNARSRSPVNGDEISVPFRGYDIKIARRVGGRTRLRIPAAPGSRNSRGTGRLRNSH